MTSSYQMMLTLTWSSLVVLAAGMLTSVSLLALVHISILLPCFYFLFHPDVSKKMTPSMWCLLALSVMMFISIVANLEIISRPSKNFSQIKYFPIAVLSILAYRELFKNGISFKKQKVLFLLSCFSITVATVSGLIGFWTGYNPLRMEEVQQYRASGLFGMLMTYAYSLSLLLVIFTGILVHARDWAKQFLSIHWLLLIYAINLAGLYFTYTRGAWIGFFAAIPFLFMFKSKKLFILITAFSILGGGLVYQFVLKEKRANTEYSDSVRIALYKAAFETGKERPLVGIGYRNFEPHSIEIKKRHDIKPDRFQGHTHNNVLEILAGTGFIGAILYVLFFITWLRELYLRRDLLGQITIAMIASFTISGMFQLTWADGPITFLMMGAYAMSLSLKRT